MPAKPTIQTRRVYEPAAPDDGLRVLVDRVWPRGLSRQQARIDRWLKDAAPSTALRRWFHHDPEKWAEFKRAYFDELAEQRDALRQLLHDADGGTLTLVYGTRDTRHNNAVALRQYLNRIKHR